MTGGVLHVQYICGTLRYVWRELFWTDDNESHIAKHDVSPDEVEEVVNTRPRYETRGKDDSVLVMGQTNAGRYLLIVLAEARALPDAWFVVTARDLNNNEARTFREKGR